MKVEEIDHIAQPRAIKDIAERPAEDERQRDDVPAIGLAPDPHRNPDGDRGGYRHQQPALGIAVGGEETQADPVVLDIGEVEDRQQHDLADFAQCERAEHRPLNQLVEHKHAEREEVTGGAGHAMPLNHTPFVLSLSKHRSCSSCLTRKRPKEGRSFDKLRTSGLLGSEVLSNMRRVHARHHLIAP